MQFLLAIVCWRECSCRNQLISDWLSKLTENLSLSLSLSFFLSPSLSPSPNSDLFLDSHIVSLPEHC